MINIITHNRLFFICLSILISIPFFINLPKVKTVDNVDYFTLEHDPDIEFYHEFKKVFGNDEFFIIAFRKENLFTFENLTLLKEITGELEGIAEIREVRSLANVNDTIGEEDFFFIKKFLEKVPETPGELAKLKARALGNPLYVKNFVSADGKSASIMVSVYGRPDDPGYRKRLIEKCRMVLDKYQDNTGQIYMAGWTTTDLYLSQYMKKDIFTFIPVTYLFITLAVFLFFRNVWLTLIAVLNISICMGSTMGLFPLFNITLNNVTTIVPPVVMALSLCDTVHIFSHLDAELLKKYPDKRMALSHILQKVLVPCLLTTVTTAIGFASLYISDVPPIKEFAIIASCGMLFEFLFSFIFLPSLILFFPETAVFPQKNPHASMTLILDGIALWVKNQYRGIGVVGLILIMISVVGAIRIRVDTNLLDFFKFKSPVRCSVDFVEHNFAGIGTFDISLQSTEMDFFKKPESLKLIETLQHHLDGIVGVDKTLSFVDFIKDMNEAFHNEDPAYHALPDSGALVAQYLLMYDSEDIDDFINGNFDHARISVRISEHATLSQKLILQGMQSFIDMIPDGPVKSKVRIRMTGRAVQDVNTVHALVMGQLYSLTTAAVIIALIMFVVLRSLSLGFLSIIPNIFPILMNFGIMGFLGIPLNTATALIAAVALGIAVDDTIHFLTKFKRSIFLGVPVEEAVSNSIKTKGKAMVLSSLILCIGFGVMILSRFVPTIYFGALSAVIMITALAGDLFILPSAALLLHKSGLNFIKFKENNHGY